MFCHKCGKEVPNTARFCHYCGAELHPIVIPPYSQQASQINTANISFQRKQPHNKKKTVVLATVYLAFCLLLIVPKLYSKGSIQSKANSVMYLEVYDNTDSLLGTASGFFIKNGKTLVTNYHVIDGASSITVMSSSGNLVTEADTVLAFDKNADLAILECDTDLGVKPLKLGDSNTVKQGDSVFAVGYPLGLANTMSNGIISSRYFDEYDVDVLQITAAISPGSSGGALFNENGFVIGVTSAYYDGGQNLNIAITSNTVQQLYSNRSTPITLSKLNKE